MLKWMINKPTGIRKAVDVDEKGRKKVLALVATAGTFIKEKVIQYTPEGRADAWLVLETSDMSRVVASTDLFEEILLTEYDSLEEAKEYVTKKYS